MTKVKAVVDQSYRAHAAKHQALLGELETAIP
jgi:hypothetical protein